MLLSIAKLQNLKAIHNCFEKHLKNIFVVINRKTTKFESNSQLKTLLFVESTVVINRKTTKFESNSQRVIATEEKSGSCYQSQNYKI